jgi:hypothetical protein
MERPNPSFHQASYFFLSEANQRNSAPFLRRSFQVLPARSFVRASPSLKASWASNYCTAKIWPKTRAFCAHRQSIWKPKALLQRLQICQAIT